MHNLHANEAVFKYARCHDVLKFQISAFSMTRLQRSESKFIHLYFNMKQN